MIDAETKQSLEGAVVVGVWAHEKISPFHLSAGPYAAREAITDSEGRFVIDAKAVEERAPRRTLPPYFVVYSPGHAAYGILPFPERAFRQGELSREGATIGLGQLKTPAERLRQLQSGDPFAFSEDPLKEIPRFVEALNRERVNLGLPPAYSPVERKGP